MGHYERSEEPSLVRIIIQALLSVFWLAGCGWSTHPPANTEPAITIDATPLPIQASANTTPTKPDSAQLTLAPAITPPPATSTPSATPTLAPISPSTSYSLTVQFNYYYQYVSVLEKVSYTNPTTETITNLVFLAEPNRYPGCLVLKGMAWGNGGAVEGYTLEGNRLSLPLPQALPPRGNVGLTIEYDLDLPSIPPPAETTRPVPFGFTDRQTNLVDWYLFLPPYQAGQGWQTHDPWYYGEHQVYDVADFQVQMQIENAASGMVVAASALPVQSGNLYTFEHQQARSFALSISPSYQVISETVGSVTVYSYAFTLDEKASRMVLKNTVEAVALYSERFGPYPHASLSVVEADFLDGMEYDGLYFLSRGFYNLYDGSPKGYLTMIAVHETAHQWSYGLVGNDQAMEPWLDEALCTYSEELFYEKAYPNQVDWWWYFRVNYYEPKGWVNKPIYAFDGFLPYRNAVYLRGATFLEELRKQIGDEAFFATLKDYAARKSHQQATTADFFAVLKQHSAVNIDDLVNEYFQP